MQSKKPKHTAFLKYSGLAMQLFVFLGLGLYGGSRLDAYLMTKTPIWTVLIGLFCFCIWFVWLYYDLQKNKNEL
ncbi:MAG TPA: hypothetical protein PK006_09815 [Saprospiraceae bacterium]|nr:hypothetical protein [Saprospiraceae bacterium]